MQSDLFLCPTWWKSDAKDVVFTMISNISIIRRYIRKLIAMLWDETAFQDLIIFFRYKPVMHVDSIFIKCFYGPSNFVPKYFQNSAEPGVKIRCPSVPARIYYNILLLFYHQTDKETFSINVLLSWCTFLW